jgi:hypothetical protein
MNVDDLLSVEAIEQARESAVEHLNAAYRELAEARRSLLFVGLGADHPDCIAIDRAWSALTQTIEVVR